MSERCREIEELLSPWRDGELDAERSRQVAEHVADCAACQARVSAWQAAEAALASRTPSRSDLEWERLAQRVDEAIDADELERIAESLPAGALMSQETAPELEDARVAARAAAPGAGPGPPSRAARARRSVRWWAVGSGLAAAALVVLFWPWFPRTGPQVLSSPGTQRERVGAGRRMDVAAPRVEDPKKERADRGTADGFTDEELPAEQAEDPAGRERVAEDTRAAEESRASVVWGERPNAAADGPEAEEAVPLEELESGLFEAAVRDDIAKSKEAKVVFHDSLVPAEAPGGAQSLAEIDAWVVAQSGGLASDDDTAANTPAARQAPVALGATLQTEQPPVVGKGTGGEPAPERALRLADAARDAGDRARAREGYLLLAGDFEGNTVREDAWYSLLELHTEEVRAGADLTTAREAGGSLEAFREEYPDSRHTRGVLAARVYVWARLVELDPAYCEGAHERVAEWQVGVEAAPIDVMRAISTIVDGCAR